MSESAKNFQALLEDLDQIPLLKSEPIDNGDDDKEIKEAAEDGEAAGNDADAGADGGADDGGDDFGKSLTVLNADGSTAEAIDGTELLKSLLADHKGLSDRVEEDSGMIMKALSGLSDLVKSQNIVITDLQGKVSSLSNAGRGRKAVVSLTDRPGAADLAKSDPADNDAMTAGDFMAKSMDAFSAGKITGGTVAVIEGYFNAGKPIPDNIVKRVLG